MMGPYSYYYDASYAVDEVSSAEMHHHDCMWSGECYTCQQAQLDGSPDNSPLLSAAMSLGSSHVHQPQLHHHQHDHQHHSIPVGITHTGSVLHHGGTIPVTAGGYLGVAPPSPLTAVEPVHDAATDLMGPVSPVSGRQSRRSSSSTETNHEGGQCVGEEVEEEDDEDDEDDDDDNNGDREDKVEEEEGEEEEEDDDDDDKRCVKEEEEEERVIQMRKKPKSKTTKRLRMMQSQSTGGGDQQRSALKPGTGKLAANGSLKKVGQANNGTSNKQTSTSASYDNKKLRHREVEKNRHRQLQAMVKTLSEKIPGGLARETQVQTMKRAARYCLYLRDVFTSLSRARQTNGIGLEGAALRDKLEKIYLRSSENVDLIMEQQQSAAAAASAAAGRK